MLAVARTHTQHLHANPQDFRTLIFRVNATALWITIHFSACVLVYASRICIWYDYCDFMLDTEMQVNIVVIHFIQLFRFFLPYVCGILPFFHMVFNTRVAPQTEWNAIRKKLTHLTWHCCFDSLFSVSFLLQLHSSFVHSFPSFLFNSCKTSHVVHTFYCTAAK